jgi:hypothetical protein
MLASSLFVFPPKTDSSQERSAITPIGLRCPLRVRLAKI